MQLVEQGKIDLQADVNEYLDFEIPVKIKRPRQEAQPITMAYLMIHTPGLLGKYMLRREHYLLSRAVYLYNIAERCPGEYLR